MNQPVPQQGQRSLAQLIANLGPISPILKTSKVDPRSLAAGIKASFASVTFKGKVWGIRYRGNTVQLLARDHNGNVLGSIPTLDVVIVKSATAISKTYYMEKFKEGDFQAPDCWSTNGVKPDPAAPKKQNDLCQPCKWNKFGSRTMDDGRKGKACSDNKRIAVVPAGDLKNEMYGGPMLLKLPPSAFAALSELETQLHMQGYRYDGLIIRLSFDHESAFPKIVFTPVGVLDDQQAQEVVALQDSDVVERILSEELTEVSGDPGQATDEAPPAPSTLPTPPTPPTPSTQQAFSTLPPPGAQSLVQQIAETQDQTIARLQALLAASQPQQAPQQEAKPRRKRSAPVTPTGPQASNGAAPETDEDEGDEPADLQSRIDALLKPPGGTPT